MTPGRQIACCIGTLAASFLLLGCGSSDSTNANIDPAIASDFTDKLVVIGQYADDGKCDRATEALATLKTAVDAESGQTGEQFTSDLQELLDELNAQIEDQCRPPEPTTSTTTETTDTDTLPTETTTEPSTTTKTTTTTSTTKSTTDTTTTQTTPPTPPTGGGNGNNPGGGISPGGKKEQGR